MANGSHIALYAGSFDPPTLGHLDVIQRARRLFDVIVVGIGENPNKQHMLEPAVRLNLMRQMVAEMLEAQDLRGAQVLVHSAQLAGLGAPQLCRAVAACALDSASDDCQSATEEAEAPPEKD